MKLALALALALVDWPGALERVDLYSALIVDARSEEVQAALLRAARLDARVTPPQWHWLRAIAADNDCDAPEVRK